MSFQAVLVHHSPVGAPVPAFVREFAREHGLRLSTARRVSDVVAFVNQTFPACIIMDGSGGARCYELCAALKADPFSAIVPVLFVLGPDAGDEDVRSGLEAGADEVLPASMAVPEARLRLRMTLRRAERDVSVHPTTRLPGTVQIERDIGERLRRGELFAVCYADLDHFKEFNDRYGYRMGDRVIRLLSLILKDVVKSHAPDGFIGHIGGDDFIFTVPLEHMQVCCEEVLEVFDELIPYQYTEEDRKAGYFLGTDRRGIVHRIPLMTLSIGVVTNEYRKFTHTARVSEIATEMKAYAKTLPGSVYAVDRRRDAPFKDCDEGAAALPSRPGLEAEGSPEPG
jgi:GGDEF domain-containing protein